MFIIGIAGKKRSGKDEVCKALMDKFSETKRCVRVGFADALKQEVAEACDVTLNDIERNKENFRLILQGWGTDFRRSLHGKNYWIHIVEQTIASLPKDTVVIIPDVRFNNELEFVLNNGGMLIKVVRPDLVDNDTHASETSLSNENFIFHHTIINNGTLTELKHKVYALHTTQF